MSFPCINFTTRENRKAKEACVIIFKKQANCSENVAKIGVRYEWGKEREWERENYNSHLEVIGFGDGPSIWGRDAALLNLKSEIWIVNGKLVEQYDSFNAIQKAMTQRPCSFVVRRLKPPPLVDTDRTDAREVYEHGAGSFYLPLLTHSKAIRDEEQIARRQMFRRCTLSNSAGASAAVDAQYPLFGLELNFSKWPFVEVPIK